MPIEKLTFDSPEGLKDLLDGLITEFSARIKSIRITRQQLIVELDKEVVLPGYGSDNLWEQLRETRVATYEYRGPLSLYVFKDIFRLIKQEGLVPVYLLIHPNSLMKRLVEWRDIAIVTFPQTTYLGLRVLEDESIDEHSFVIAAGHSPDAQVSNIMLGVKGYINDAA